MGIVKTVAILSPGDMGSNVGRALRENGFEVITCLTDRSQRTVELSEIAGITNVPDFEDMIERADLVLSVLVPERAVDVARQVAAVILKSGKPLPFADCNPVPQQSLCKWQKSLIPLEDDISMGELSVAHRGGESRHGFTHPAPTKRSWGNLTDEVYQFLSWVAKSDVHPLSRCAMPLSAKVQQR